MKTSTPHNTASFYKLEQKIVAMKYLHHLIHQGCIVTDDLSYDDKEAIQHFAHCWDELVATTKTNNKVDHTLFNKCMAAHTFVCVRIMAGWLLVIDSHAEVN